MISDNRKLKVYLDTSVISHLYQLDAPEKMAETLALWDKFKKGGFDIYLSDVTIDEVDGCQEDKKVKLFGFTILEMKAFLEENKKKYYLLAI